MRVYNSKHWIKLLLSLDNGDTLKPLAPGMLLMALYSAIIAYVELEVLDLSSDSSVKNVAMLHSLLGFVLSLLLVFRTNTAYDRWWEGRKLMGRLVNDSRNFSSKINAILPQEDQFNRDFFIKYISFFPHLLTRHLSQESTRLELDKNYHDIAEFEKLPHPPIALISKLIQRVQVLYSSKIITGEQMIILDHQLNGFLEVCGGCERIKNTPIPYSYSSFIKKFIIIYVATLPIGYAMNIGYMAIPLTVFIFYILMSLEVIAEEIEDPFNNEDNDIPTLLIAQNIEHNVDRIFKD